MRGNNGQVFRAFKAKIYLEGFEHEEGPLKNIYTSLKLVEGKSVYLEEFAREMIAEEENHVAEVKKMLRVQPR